MKFFKNMLIIATVCNLGSIHAKTSPQKFVPQRKENVVANIVAEVKEALSPEVQYAKDMAQFIDKLVQDHEIKVNNFIEKPNMRPGKIFSPIMAQIKEKYPDRDDQIKATAMLINKITEKFKGIDKEVAEHRIGNMYEFIRRNLNYWKDFPKI